MIYTYNKETNEFLKEYASTKEAAQGLDTTQGNIQKVLDGTLPSLKGVGIIYKPEEEPEGSTSMVQTYYQEQQRTFSDLTDGLCSWTKLTQLRKDDIVVEKSSINIGRAIQLLRDGYIAIPF